MCVQIENMEKFAFDLNPDLRIEMPFVQKVSQPKNCWLETLEIQSL